MPDASERFVCGASANEAAAEVGLVLARSYAEAPNMHTISLTHKG